MPMKNNKKIVSQFCNNQRSSWKKMFLKWTAESPITVSALTVDDTARRRRRASFQVTWPRFVDQFSLAYLNLYIF